MVLLRFEVRAGRRVAICASTHLTDFVSVVQRDLPTVNRVDPVGDSGILQNYLRPENLFPLIIISVLLGAFLFAWVVSAVMEGYTSPEMRKLRQAHMLHFGRIRSEMGMDSLHLEDQLEMYLRVLEAHSKNLRRIRMKQAERDSAASIRRKTTGLSASATVLPAAAAAVRYSVAGSETSGAAGSPASDAIEVADGTHGRRKDSVAS